MCEMQNVARVSALCLQLINYKKIPMLSIYNVIVKGSLTLYSNRHNFEDRMEELVHALSFIPVDIVSLYSKLLGYCSVMMSALRKHRIALSGAPFVILIVPILG